MRKGQKTSEETKEKLRQANLGKKHKISPEGYEKISRNFLRGGWNKGLRISEKWREKIRQARLGKTTSDKQKKKAKENWLCENNPRWKGGKEFWKPSEKEHLSSRYVAWANDVKQRDGWKCKIGNVDCEGRLESHHILNWMDFPELRYDVNNGITLCQFHHPHRKKIVSESIPIFRQLIGVR